MGMYVDHDGGQSSAYVDNFRREDPSRDFGAQIRPGNSERNERPASPPTPSPSAPANVISKNISLKVWAGTEIQFGETVTKQAPPDVVRRLPSKPKPSSSADRSQKTKEFRREASEIGLFIRHCREKVLLIDVYDVDERTYEQNSERDSLSAQIDASIQRLEEIARVSAPLAGFVQDILTHRASPHRDIQSEANLHRSSLRLKREQRLLEARIADNLDNDLRELTPTDYKNRGKLEEEIRALDDRMKKGARAENNDVKDASGETSNVRHARYDVKRIPLLVATGGDMAQMELRERLKNRCFKKDEFRKDKKVRQVARKLKADPSYFMDQADPEATTQHERANHLMEIREERNRAFMAWLQTQEETRPVDPADDDNLDEVFANDPTVHERYQAPSIWDDPIRAAKRLQFLEFDHGLGSISADDIFGEEISTYDPTTAIIDPNDPASIARWNRYVLRTLWQAAL